jgi:hypothetical protein
MTTQANTDAMAKAARLAAWQERLRARQAEQLAASEPEEVELPSGLTVLAVRADMRVLLEAGKLPDGLTGYTLALLNAGQTSGKAKLAALLTEQLAEWTALMDAMWLASVVDPVFTADAVASDTAIPMRRVDFDDKVAFFNWSNGVSNYLADFRDAGEPARTASDGESLRPGPGAAGGDQSRDGAADGVAIPAGDVLRRNHRRGKAQRDAANPGAKPGPSAAGPALEPGSEMDLSPSDRQGAAAARRNRRGQRTAPVAGA